MTEILIGTTGIGATLITLFALDSKGVLNVNTRALQGLLVAGGLYVGWRFTTLLTTFL